MGNVLRRAQAAQGRFLSQLWQYLRRQGIQHIRADNAGCHAVDPDVGGGQLHGQGAGQTDQRRLGAGVCHLTAGAPLTPDGGNVHDAACVLVEHVGQHRLDGVERAVHIDGEVPVPQLRGDVLEQGLTRHTGVVHQQRYRAEGFLHLPHHGCHLVLLRHVGLDHHGPAALCRQLLQQRPGAVLPDPIVDAYGPALPGQLRRHGPPDAPG